jgi:kynurenine formamidase
MTAVEEKQDPGGWLEPDWDRFGPHDDRGALNYITPQRVLAAAGLVRQGEVISLNRSLAEQPWSDAREPARRVPLATNRVTARGDGYYTVFNDDKVEFALQGASHLDGLAHAGVIEPGSDDVFYGGRPLDEVGPQGAQTLGIEKYGAIVARGILVDVVACIAEGARSIAGDTVIDADTIRACFDRQKVQPESGDALLLYTGYENACEDEGGFPNETAGTGPDTTPLWRELEISLLAADNVAVEKALARSAMAEPGARRRRDLGNAHYGALRNLGIPLGEMWALEKLAQVCRRDAVYEFLLVSVPLNLPGAFGSPANAVAVR